MLDSDTKRRIDTARDILVGKVPDPKSQVEQITIALIYKFMDDMDAESEELGGKRKFFAGKFAHYGWPKLVRSGLGGHEVLNLYAEAITRMPENPGIPPLFRDIFKNAYLPYRDPETLRSFLKIIDEFEYDHSERLGDAFEYLLSVLGSQGDAGQFRTPRHIIDFIVAVIDPKKDATVLDPACGTAGFLISAYKHILRANMDGQEEQDKNKPDTPGNPAYSGELSTTTSALTPDEKGRLATNFKGYDISPDMVRLSLVNLYLHGFVAPQIHEYDTLTSEDRWNDYADVILANPPFMSPKGGIRPHNRFSVKSKRSEVLFVDYMAEHLTPNGRAGIIVPEGIIFQSQNAYKQLRKMLVEEYLVAVVSLPAGVFNPYSGVKTSILILDKALAKRTDRIAFFKAENDGFDLGAQRREIKENDLPQIEQAVREYMNMDAQDGQDKEESSASMLNDLIRQGSVLIVAKEKITANGEYNLSGERYRKIITTNAEWPFVEVKNIFRKVDETILPQSLSGPVNYVGLENISQNSGQLLGSVVKNNPREIRSLKNVFQPSDILYGKLRPYLNKVWLTERDGICSTDIFVIRPKDENVLPELYAHIFRCKRFNEAVWQQRTGSQLPRIGWTSFSNLKIPFPPLEVQLEIVAEIEGYQKVIDGARAVVDNYRPHITINPDWPRRNLGELAQNLDSRRIPIAKANRKAGAIPYYGASGVVDYVDDYIFDEDILLISEDGANLIARSTPIAFSVTGKCWVNNHAHVLKFESLEMQKLVEVYLNSISIEGIVTGSAQPKLNQQALNKIPIPTPNDIVTQKQIIGELETEKALIAANRELIERIEYKIRTAIDRVWGETKTETTDEKIK